MNLKLAIRLWIRAARYRWRLDAPEIRRMIEAIPRGGNAIDVGAHKGAYTYWMARKAGTSGHVVAIEPQGDLCGRLRASLASVGLSRVEVVESALSDSVGTCTFHIPTNTSTQSATLSPVESGTQFRSIEVKTTTIDQLVESRGWTRLDFMKIDAEGHELQIFAGAGETLTRHKPAILVEAEARKHGDDASHLETLMQVLAPLGYKGHFNDGVRWRPLDELRVEEHQTFGQGRFCNNIFLTARGEDR